MKTGIVKFFNESKGYGFIKEDGTDKEIFVHAADLNGVKIKQNDHVQFELGESPKGPLAIKIEKI